MQSPLPLPAFVLLLGALHVPAAALAVGSFLETSVEQHATSNALDDHTGLFDTYTALRGSLKHSFGDTSLSLTLEADAQARLYDRYTIENDAGLGLGATVATRPSDRAELRGTVFWRLFDEGDTIDAEDLIIGTRTRRNTLGGRVETGIGLAPDLVLVLAAEAARDFYGDTAFEDDILSPAASSPTAHARAFRRR